MALPSSGTIKLSEIKTEFGGPNNLRSYLRGGTYVPSIPPNNSIPTSGTLSLTDFYGAKGVLDTQTITVGLWVSTYVFYGYGSSGSISDGTANAFGGANILALYWYSDGTQGNLRFNISGNIAADSNKYIYPSSGVGTAKDFSSTNRVGYFSVGNYTTFEWITPTNQNPMPTSGATVKWYFY